MKTNLFITDNNSKIIYQEMKSNVGFRYFYNKPLNIYNQFEYKINYNDFVSVLIVSNNELLDNKYISKYLTSLLFCETNYINFNFITQSTTNQLLSFNTLLPDGTVEITIYLLPI